SGTAADYSHLRVFGCTAYAHVDNGKLEHRAIKCLFLGYDSGVKGYKLWNPETKKTFMSRSVVFNESVMFIDSLSTDDTLVEKLQPQVSVQVELMDDQENEVVGNDISDSVPDTVQYSTPVSQSDLQHEKDVDLPIALHRSKRSCGSPNCLIEECNMTYYALSCAEQVEDACELAIYSKAVDSVDKEKWISAMQEEMQSLEKNGTWEIVSLPEKKKTVCCK